VSAEEAAKAAEREEVRQWLPCVPATAAGGQTVLLCAVEAVEAEEAVEPEEAVEAVEVQGPAAAAGDDIGTLQREWLLAAAAAAAASPR
jgi:hypothetical protein